MNNRHNSGVSPDETAVTKPKRTINALRALDYRHPATAKRPGRFQRCSRCHSEVELDAPVLYSSTGEHAAATNLMPIMVGQDLLGFVCSGCFLSMCRHVVSIFPDEQGFPFVNESGILQPPPRCDVCAAALAYTSDGRTVICPQCDRDSMARLSDELDATPADPIVVDGANG